MKTKKVGSAGRFGARYGKKVRTRVIAVEQEQKRKHRCPYCLRFTVKRRATGIFRCTKCDNVFTGKAYFP